MPKAHLTLPNGTRVEIEGTAEEVHRLLTLAAGEATPKRAGRTKSAAKAAKAKPAPAEKPDTPDLSEIANLVKDCEEAVLIEKNILDQTSTIDRVLLPLYALKKYAGSDAGLTSGEISKVTVELGVPVSQSNTSTALSGVASKYVMGDKVRKKGQAVRYRLSRRGEQYLAVVVQGKHVGK
jgi:hypothetical protein